MPIQSLRAIPASEPLTDAELIPRLRAGDASALTAAFERHATGLLRLAYRLTGSQPDAQDLVQDLFVGLPEALARYEERGQFGAWLRRIVVRMALMRRRTSQRTQESALELAPEVLARPHEPTDRMTLTALLAQLPEDQRAVVVLRTLEGYSHAEVAELLGIRRNTVEVRFHRAMGRLRDLVEEP